MATFVHIVLHVAVSVAGGYGYVGLVQACNEYQTKARDR